MAETGILDTGCLELEPSSITNICLMLRHRAARPGDEWRLSRITHNFSSYAGIAMSSSRHPSASFSLFSTYSYVMVPLNSPNRSLQCICSNSSCSFSHRYPSSVRFSSFRLIYRVHLCKLFYFTSVVRIHHVTPIHSLNDHDWPRGPMVILRPVVSLTQPI